MQSYRGTEFVHEAGTTLRSTCKISKETNLHEPDRAATSRHAEYTVPKNRLKCVIGWVRFL